MSKSIVDPWSAVKAEAKGDNEENDNGLFSSNDLGNILKER